MAVHFAKPPVQMGLTLTHICRLFWVHPYEIMVFLISILIFSILLALKVSTNMIEEDVSWWWIFSPLFIGAGLNAYHILILCIRMCLAGQVRTAIWRTLWSLAQLICILVFELLACWQLVDSSKAFTPAQICAPLLTWVGLMTIKACHYFSANFNDY